MSDTIGIIGGNGRMGRLMRGQLEADGYIVYISDTDTERTNREIAGLADIVIVSVPIDKTTSVIEELADVLTPQHLLMDVTSIKTEPMKAMQKTQAEVIGLHPMFGPSIESLRNQTIVLTPASENSWFFRVKRYCEEKGMRTKVTTPSYHDKMMAVIQVLVHFNTIATGHTLAKLGFDINETLEFTSPIYRMELAMIGRIFAQDGHLYGTIPMKNPHTQETLDAHQETIRRMQEMISEGEIESFVSAFEETSSFFRNFKEQALQESEELIRHLYRKD